MKISFAGKAANTTLPPKAPPSWRNTMTIKGLISYLKFRWKHKDMLKDKRYLVLYVLKKAPLQGLYPEQINAKLKEFYGEQLTSCDMWGLLFDITLEGWARASEHEIGCYTITPQGANDVSEFYVDAAKY
jgi:hypothetical protein